MGQFHKLYNIDKKEYVHGHRINNGLKLMEQCGHEKPTSTALWLLLASSNGKGGGDAKKHYLVGSWAGDRITIQGDYAEESDKLFIPESELDKFQDISQGVAVMLENEFS